MTLVVFLLISLIGGFSGALVKFTVAEFSPVVLTFLRSFISTLIILPFVYREGIFPKIVIDKNLLVVNIFFWMNWLFFAAGVQKTSLLMASIAYLPVPLIVAFIGFLWLKEKLSREQIIGLVLSLTGISILVFQTIRTQDILSFGTPLGNILLSIAVFCWALYLVTSRKISKIHSPLKIIFFNFLASSILSAPLAFLDLLSGKTEISNTTQYAFLSLLALALFSSVVVFYLIQWLVKHTSAFIPSLTLYLTSTVGGLTGIIFYHEKLTNIFVLSALLILSGIFLATSFRYVRNNIKIWI